MTAQVLRGSDLDAKPRAAFRWRPGDRDVYPPTPPSGDVQTIIIGVDLCMVRREVCIHDFVWRIRVYT